ncbi:uncharacterized protein KY384_004563 [Bacidia gigantensis]|uniref:uncharacterized protein n=1 Tax=Bacidia gigantensis TaxID=2732470 RepID=UPI001D038688|nr:uncharacterized protein KY384_004563 [Bacidia gigantensis]KAG8531205.1 hypothetical protein KY384_004563 [Bacidia gigantensis]
MYPTLIAVALAMTSKTLVTASPQSKPPCTKLVLPTNFYGITNTSPAGTLDYGPHKPDPYFDFQVSQTSDGGQGLPQESDLIATYTTLPCKSTEQYQLEFYFDPISDYSYSGPNTRIDIWRVDGNIPRDKNGKGKPTWNNIGQFAEIYVGGFKMPSSEAEQKPTSFLVGNFLCKRETSFRVSIANSKDGNPELSGSVRYPQEYAGAKETGLRVRYNWKC